VPHRDLDGESAQSSRTVLRREGLLDDGLVGFVFDVHLAGSHVLELRVVNALLRDDLATNQQHTHDLKSGDFTHHAHLAESVLPEVIQSLHEAFEQVLELVLDSALLANFLVVEVPEGVSFIVDLVHESLEAFTSLVGMVHVECLEVEEIEGAGRQSIKWVDFLLGRSVLTCSILRLGGSLLLSGLLGLLLALEDGLEGLLGHLDLSEDGDELGKGSDALKPGGSFGGGLGDALVEDELESDTEGGGNGDISQGGFAADEPVASEALVERANVVLDLLDRIVELSLGDFGAESHDGEHGGVVGLLDA